MRVFAILMLAWASGCSGCADTAKVDPSPATKIDPTGKPGAPVDIASDIQKAEAASAERASERRPCGQPVSLYEGSIPVVGTDYIHQISRGGDVVEETIDGLDRVVSKAETVRFTLDYPFEKPLAGTVTGKISVRRIIDAIRAGFRTMFEGTTQKDIPGMMNKEVRGPYGKSFHVIGDLVIESIHLCNDDSLEIGIGS